MTEELGYKPDKYEFFEHTHTTDDGQYVDQRSKLVGEEVKRRLTELTREGSNTIDRSAVFLGVVGGVKKQRVYGLGFLSSEYTTSCAGTYSCDTPSLDQDAFRKLENKIEQQVSARVEAEMSEIAEMKAQIAQMAEMKTQMAEMAQMNAWMQEIMQRMFCSGMPPAV